MISMKTNRGWFKKGVPSWNKGKKRTWKSRTEFEKGHTPQHTKPVGSVFTTASGRREIKIAMPRKWKRLAHYNWEKAFGKIPKGMLIHHKDGDLQNDSVENLELVSRAEHLSRHRADFNEKRLRNLRRAFRKNTCLK